MIYTDRIHLVADSLDELHQFAKEVGLKRTWFQNHPKHPHYDITTDRKFRKIISYRNVILVSSRVLVKISKNMVI